MSVEIRQVEDKDLDQCHFVESNCFTSEAATREKIDQRIMTYPGGFFVAELDGKIVGIINGASTDVEDISNEELKDLASFDENGKNVVIFSLAVLPGHQRKGVAKLLLNKFIDVFTKLKKEKILLLCKEHHIELYRKFGFTLMGKSKSGHGGFEWFEMRLLLR